MLFTLSTKYLKFYKLLNSLRNATITTFLSAINNLDDWIKPDYVRKSMINKMNTIYNIYEPLGVCLIIGAWNYPVQITLLPLASAIAAGKQIIDG